MNSKKLIFENQVKTKVITDHTWLVSVDTKDFQIHKVSQIKVDRIPGTSSFKLTICTSKGAEPIVFEVSHSGELNKLFDLFKFTMTAGLSIHITYLEEDKKIDDLAESGELCDHCGFADYGSRPVNTNQHNMCEGSGCKQAYGNYLADKETSEVKEMKAKQVIFNDPATIVMWEDGTKTVVKCSKNDKFDPEKGFLVAYFQKHSGLTKTAMAKMLDKITDQ